MTQNKANITLLDIETSPIIGYAWSTWDTNLLKVLEPTKIISMAWKSLGDKKTQVRALCDYKGYKANVLNDKALMGDIWDVLNEADIVVAHNGQAFDTKKINARFIINGLDAPRHYEVIDTLKVAKKYFKFDSNSLDSLGSYLGEGEKIANGGFGLWTACMAGDLGAWKRMKDYNVRDVELLERIYLRLRPFMNGDHPDVNLVAGNFSRPQSCHICGSEHVQKRGYSFTKTGRKQRYQCSDCGSWSSGSFERVRGAPVAEPVEVEED